MHRRGSEGETGEWSGQPVPFTLPRNTVIPALLLLMLTTRLPVVDWTEAPADLNGLVRFAERRNLVSAHVPSHFNWPLTYSLLTVVHGVRQQARSDSVLHTWITFLNLWPEIFFFRAENKCSRWDEEFCSCNHSQCRLFSYGIILHVKVIFFRTLGNIDSENACIVG